MEIEVKQIRQRIELDPEGRMVQVIRARYIVDGQGPFTIDMPKEEFTAEEMDRRIKEEAGQVSRLMGSMGPKETGK